MRGFSIIAAALLVTGTATAQPMQSPPPDSVNAVYTAPNWGAAINTLPCTAFTQKAPGVWETNGTFKLGAGGGPTMSNVYVGHLGAAMNPEATGTFSEVTLDHTKYESTILDQRCGK